MLKDKRLFHSTTPQWLAIDGCTSHAELLSEESSEHPDATTPVGVQRRLDGLAIQADHSRTSPH
jgi:hypothetical protein